MDDSRRTIGLSALNALALAGLTPRLLTLIGDAARRRRRCRQDRAHQIARHLPNVEFRTQDGRRVRFYDDLVKDKKVLINFMYTECSGTCPRTTSNLVKVHEHVRRPHGPRRVLPLHLADARSRHAGEAEGVRRGAGCGARVVLPHRAYRRRRSGAPEPRRLRQSRRRAAPRHPHLRQRAGRQVGRHVHAGQRRVRSRGR